MHIMNRLFEEWDHQGIRYVHFKSNVNLDYSFEKTGDFDVLVDPLRQSDVCSALLSLHAKQMNTVNDKRYPGVDNWLLFDPQSGRIHHLHLHYQLMSGKAYIKEYCIPWRELLFETRVYDEKWKLYVSDPSLELILLSVRTVIKAHFSDRVKAHIGLYRTHKSLQQERAYLIEHAKEEKLDEYLDRLFGSTGADKIRKIVLRERIGSGEFLRLSKVVRRNLAADRRMSGVRAGWLSTVRTFRYLYNRVMKKCDSFVSMKKTSMSKGAIIAFVGVDGSGKSTTSKEIYKWLSKQFDCKKVYMGLGDGKTTFLAAVMKKGRKLTKKGSSGNSESINSKNAVNVKPVSFFRNPRKYIKKRLLISAIYSVEKNNEKNMRRMHRFRINGGISLLDRYPQIELPNKNDGPKIDAYRQIIRADRFLDRMVRKEAERMQIVKKVKPDLVFRLNITAQESMRRKDDQTDITVVEGKISDLESITFQNARIIDIDATQPYEQELLEIKQAIWDFL